MSRIAAVLLVTLSLSGPGHAEKGGGGSPIVQTFFASSTNQLLPLGGEEPGLPRDVGVGVVFSDDPDMDRFSVMLSLNSLGSDALAAILGDLDGLNLFSPNDVNVQRSGSTYSTPALISFVNPSVAIGENFTLDMSSGTGSVQFPGQDLRVVFSLASCDSGDFCECEPDFTRCTVEEEGEGEEDGTAFSWAAQDGDYSEPSNWDPMQLPTSEDRILFTQNSSYRVTLSGHAAQRAEFSDGTVELAGGALDLQSSLLTPTRRSLVVGTFRSNTTTLNLHNSALDTIHTAIGRDELSDGVVNVEGENLGWTNQGLLSVGLNGAGLLSIGEAATVLSGESRIGDGIGSVGEVDVFTIITPESPSKGETQPLSFWLTSALAIGFEGIGDLTIDDGLVASAASFLGAFPGSNGTVTLSGTGQSEWTVNQEGLSVGDEGIGTLLIRDGSRGEVSGPTLIGRAPGSFGTVDVDSANVLSADDVSTWTTNDLDIGFEGVGSMDIGFGIVLSEDATLGVESSGIGVVVLEDENTIWETMALVVGDRGTGTIVSSSTIESEIILVGRLEDSCGEIILTGGNLNSASHITIGGTSQGRIELTAGATMSSQNGIADIGSAPGGIGEVVIETAPSIWGADEIFIGSVSEEGVVEGVGTLTLRDFGNVLVSRTIEVSAGGAIQGIGFIDATSVNNNGGVLAPGGTDFSPDIDCALEEDEGEAKQDDPFGTLDLDADLEMTGGSIVARIGGTNEGEFDQLVVTGNASLTDATIDLTFTEGFTPTTGDEFPVVMVSGALTTDNVTTTVSGADPTFEFELMEAGGMLMVMTTQGADPGGEGEGEAEGMGEPGGCAAGGGSPGSGSLPGTEFALLLASVVILARARMGITSRPPSR